MMSWHPASDITFVMFMLDVADVNLINIPFRIQNILPDQIFSRYVAFQMLSYVFLTFVILLCLPDYVVNK